MELTYQYEKNGIRGEEQIQEYAVVCLDTNQILGHFEVPIGVSVTRVRLAALVDFETANQTHTSLSLLIED